MEGTGIPVAAHFKDTSAPNVTFFDSGAFMILASTRKRRSRDKVTNNMY